MEWLNKKILCIGEVLWDRLPSGAKPGGALLNVAIHLNSLGKKVSLTSRIGNDLPGKELIAFMEYAGLGTEFIQVDKYLPTSEVLVSLDEKNNAIYEICESVAWDNLLINSDLKRESEDAGVLIYGSLASRNPVSRKTIMNLLESDGIKVMDVNFRRPYDSKEIVESLLNKADIVKMNDDELLEIARWNGKSGLDNIVLAKWFALHYNLQLVCLTRGSKGAMLCNNKIVVEHPGFIVNVVDTVGAGDAFLAGLVTALLDNKPYFNALEFACAIGAFVASKSGATPRYNLENITEILNSRTGNSKS